MSVLYLPGDVRTLLAASNSDLRETALALMESRVPESIIDNLFSILSKVDHIGEERCWEEMRGREEGVNKKREKMNEKNLIKRIINKSKQSKKKKLNN